MSIIKAEMNNLSVVKDIAVKTITQIYPHYYPKGAVEFFVEHHNEENIRKDIQLGRVFLCLDELQNIVGTVTIKDNEICRLFVLPECQGLGFGRELLDYAEYCVSQEHNQIILDASLPAKGMYRKRGYVETETNYIKTNYEDYLCYDVMEKVQNRILLTTFSGTSAETLVRGCKYRCLLLPNDKVKDSELLMEKISKESFDYVVSFGQRPNIKNKVHIETIAGDEHLQVSTDFDCRWLQNVFEQKGIDAKISCNAGASFCNQLYYNGLRYINQSGVNTKMVFVHVPFEKNVDDFEGFQEKVFEVIEEIGKNKL